MLLCAVFSYPWLEAWATGDKSEHHLLDRPRNAATRTAIGSAFLAFYVILFFSAGNDLIAHNFHLAINHITYFFRVFVFVGPLIAFWSAKRIALSLQRRDIDKLLHGRETGNVLRLPHGEFIEIHAPLSEKERAKIMSKPEITPLALPAETDSNGVRQPNLRAKRWQAKLSGFFHRDNVAMPSAQALAEAQHHLEAGQDHNELTH